MLNLDMLKASFSKYDLQFLKPSGTSRGILNSKRSWFLKVWDEREPDCIGIGEVGHLEGLSMESQNEVTTTLKEVCASPDDPNWLDHALIDVPSVRFALEQALIDLDQDGDKILFPSSFTEGTSPISINGLVWMGPIDVMRRQVREKIESGFSCIKLKIGALNFEEEFALLKEIRSEFSEKVLEIRVDANGAFSPEEAMKKLERLATLQLHSIEQPIRQGQQKKMFELCANSPLPIALDEELIGINSPEKKEQLLEQIKPQFIILKPSLLGGIRSCEEWIMASAERDISMWITSALESNIGLNAIAQWTATLNTNMPQGLGTGQLYSNNIPSPLEVRDGYLHYNRDQQWNTALITENGTASA